jgi:hypothetical protein
MPKIENKFVNKIPVQMTIDDFISSLSQDTLPDTPVNGSCDVDAQLRGIINEAIRESKKSREQIAELMSTVLNGKITKVQIDGWTRADSDRYIPLQHIHAFEIACGTVGITEYLCKLHGGKFIDQKSSDVMDLGQLQVFKAQLAVKERELKRGLA